LTSAQFSNDQTSIVRRSSATAMRAMDPDGLSIFSPGTIHDSPNSVVGAPPAAGRK